MLRPLRDDAGGPGLEDGRAMSIAEDAAPPQECRPMLTSALVDIVLCAVFFAALFLVSRIKLSANACFAFVGVAMVLWRLNNVWRPSAPSADGVEIPYTCGYVSSGGKELFVVATVHVSPRAPKDVEVVIGRVNPDLVMIELDEERLTDMREEDTLPRDADLQPMELEAAGRETVHLKAQRAHWNGEYSGAVIQGPPIFDEADQYGLQPREPGSRSGTVVVVRRGVPPGQFGTWSLKASIAARAGASAVLVLQDHPKLPPVPRIGAASLVAELKVAARTRNCGFPPIPLLLLPREAGEELLRCTRDQRGAQVKFQVLQDDFPRRTLRRLVCQTIGFLLSGFWILYGIIECFKVDAGEEFIKAEEVARRSSIPCVCIDVDTNELCSRIRSAVVPTPCNIVRALLAWISFPRALWSALFPGRGNVDVIGSTVLHAMSFGLRIWMAMMIAAVCAGGFVAVILLFFSHEAAGAAAGGGVIKPDQTDALQTGIMLIVEMYAFPRLYEAVAASRDEAMYQAVVAKAGQRSARRLVVVVGAAHANGILQRARTRGLGQ